MPAQRFEADELDQATLDYLHEVVQSEGRGMPGLYYDADDGKVGGRMFPLWAFIAGPLVMLLTLIVTYASPRSPVPVALLMTGGYFLGGWLIVAAARSLIARGRERFIGYFEYVDPLYLWHGRGTAVEVESLSMVTSTEPIGSRVRIEKTDGAVDLELRSSRLADEVSDYLTAIPEVHDTDPVKRGYEAKTRVLADDHDDARIEAIPSPQRAHSSRGWLVFLVLAASVVGLFFCCKALAISMRDSAIFELVNGKDPGHLRLYLIDPRNTRHRDQIIKQLETYHNRVASDIENRKGDPAVTFGLANIIRGLKDQGRPVITVRFASSAKGPSVPEGYFSSATQTEQNLYILTELRKLIRPLVGVQTAPEPFVAPETIDLVDVALVLEDPAMIFIEAKVKPVGMAVRECVITWTVTFQATPDGEKKVATFDAKMSQSGDDPTREVRALYRSFAHSFQPRLGP